MAVTRDELLSLLPAYRDEWVLIHPDQSVKDIVIEVLDAHDEFAPYYDLIAFCFDIGSTSDIARTLYDFCERNIEYREETEDHQSSSLPTGILTRGYGDCKHYAGFIGGVLDALNRSGKKIDWVYRFASYDVFDRTPHHVFIVVFDRDKNETWIDPTPGSGVKIPVYQLDKKIKANNMALVRNIAGFNDGRKTVGIASLTVTPFTRPGEQQLNFSAQGIEPSALAGMWPVYLGLSDYRDYSGDRDISEWQVAAQLNALIAQHGGTHQVTGDFVKWVYDNSIRSWNFYFPGGVQPDFDGSYWLNKYEIAMNQPGWPMWLITPDGRLTIDHDVKVDDYRNAGIEILTAWAQDIINTYDKTPYPVKPAAVKEFTQNYTGNPGNPNANFFNEARGSSVFSDIGHAFESAINWVKDIGLTVIGSIPRNAFLALVGLNVFHMADHLQEHINAGDWGAISDKWTNLGGNPDKLKATIEHGTTVPAIESVSQNVDETISVVQVAAIIAAAAPIITAMLTFLNKDGKLNPFIKTAETQLQTQFPGADFSFLNGALTSGGTPVPYRVAPVDDENSPYYNGGTQSITFGGLRFNPKAALIAVGIAGVVYFMMNRTPRGGQPKKKNYLIPAVAGLGAYLVANKYMSKTVTQLQPAPMQQQQQLPAPGTQTSFASALLPALVQSADTLLAQQQSSAPPADLTAGGGIDYNLGAGMSPDQTTYAV